jgi:hypothetical protein
MALRKRYLDDGLGGGSKNTVDKLVRLRSWSRIRDPSYSGTVKQITGLGRLSGPKL